MQYFAQGKDTLEFSSRLIHRWPSNDKHSKFRLEWASAYVAEQIGDLLTENAYRGILKDLIKDPRGSASGIVFEAYVLRIFREGGHTFELKDLKTGKRTEVTVPQQPDTIHFKKMSEARRPGTLFNPKVRNYACIDMLLSPSDLFQITVSRQHPVNGPLFSRLMESIIKEKGWVNQPANARLIFVVPSNVYDDFKEQNYLSSEKEVYRRLPTNVGPVKQYALKIDLESGAAGKEPGLPLPAQSPPRILYQAQSRGRNRNQAQASGRNRNQAQVPGRKQLDRKCKK